MVGRDAELAVVERFLDRTRVSASVLLVQGEAGIGKTTIWLAAIESATSRGALVLQARPAESEARLSYATVADLVDAVFDETRRDLPPVQQRALAAALLRSEADEPAQPRTTATALVGVLSALAVDQPVLVAIDDVQWLDPASAAAIAFVARRLPDRVGLLLTRRGDPGDDAPLGLARALPEGALERIQPGPFSLAALHHLISGRLGSAPPRPVLARIAEASNGNPFFALEIVQALGGDWSDLAPGEPLPIPRSLEELVRERVNGLSEPARLAALACAALSRPTPSTVARAVSERGDGRRGLLEAEEAGVLTVATDRVRFTHPLLASAVYGSATPERRRQLHESLAGVVTDLEERAHHLALCTTEADEFVAAELERAARQAANRGAQQAAAELYAGARRLTPDESGSVGLARRGLGEASALFALGDVAGSRERARQVAETSSVDALRARARLLLGEIAWVAGGGNAIEELDLALECAVGDSELTALVLRKLVNVTVGHDPANTIQRARAAVAAINPEQDPAALASVYFDWAWAEMVRGNGAQPDLLENWEMLEERAGPDAPKSLFGVFYFNSIDDFDAARARFAVEDRWYSDRGEDVWRAERRIHYGSAELRAGRFELAEQLVEEGCDALTQLDTPGPWTATFRLRAIVDAHRGRTDRARETLRPLIAQAESAGRAWWEALLLSALAFVELADANHREADRALTRMHERIASVGVRDFLPDRSEPYHIEALVALGEPERAREVLEQLEWRGRNLPRLWIDATLPRARALVLAAEGDVAGGLVALDQLDVEAAAKLPFDLAWTLLVRGRLHRRVKQKRAAAEALHEALGIFERLGARAWEAQARAELDRVGLRRSSDELTATERRVAELAARGLTNREVAARAFMSPKTVQANLTRIYRKLGISSRAELGARMAEERRPLIPQK